MYLAGFIGLQNEISKPLFIKLTAFNLWVSLILLLFFHENWNRKSVLFFSIIFLLGFFIEVIGVKTGVIFGNYFYGETLGTKLLEVPIAIGANWLILCYVSVKSFQNIIGEIKGKNIVITLLSSGLMVALDTYIEPIAIKYDFWQWAENTIPIRNYVGWFIISFAFNYLLVSQKTIFKNKIASLLLLLQLLFFTLQNIQTALF